MDNAKIAAMTVNIVSAYVQNNRVDADDVTSMLTNVGAALRTAANPAPAPTPEEPRKRRVVRRRGGKVVDGSENNDGDTNSALIEDAANDELVDGGEKISVEENMVAPPTIDASGGDAEFNEHGHRKQPEPMFD